MTRDELVEVLRAEETARASVPPWLQIGGAVIAAAVGLVTLAGGMVATIAAAVMVSTDLAAQGVQIAELAGELKEVRAELGRMRLEVAERTGDRWSRTDHDRWVRERYEVDIEGVRADIRALEVGAVRR